MTTPKLPEKLSDLLDLAVSDAIKCEEDPRYRLNMDTYHTPEKDGCHVCLAGAVMAQTMGAKPTLTKRPWSWHLEAEGDYNPFRKIDAMRSGFFPGAGDYLQCVLRALVTRDFMPDLYRAPWKTYRECARILREAGL